MTSCKPVLSVGTYYYSSAERKNIKRKQHKSKFHYPIVSHSIPNNFVLQFNSSSVEYCRPWFPRSTFLLILSNSKLQYLSIRREENHNNKNCNSCLNCYLYTCHIPNYIQQILICCFQ